MKEFISSILGDRKKLSIAIIVLIAAALPLTVFVAQKQQEIRQRAAGEQTTLFFAKGPGCLSPATTASFSTNTTITLSLCLNTNNTGINIVNSFDITIGKGTGITFTGIADGVDEAKLTQTAFNTVKSDGTIRYSKVDLNNTISGNALHLGTITLTTASTGTGNISITQAQIVSPASTTTALTVAKPILPYTISATANTTPTPTVSAKAPPCFIPASILTQLNLPANTVRGYGDVDLDGDVDSNDSLLILRFVAQLDTPTPIQTEVGDVDTAWGVLSGSSSITSVDSLMVQRFLANLTIPSGYPGTGTINLPVCAGQPTATPTPTVTLTPTPTTAPILDCNGGGSCTTCQSNQSNTCNGSGTQTCTYTTYNGDARCNTVTSQVTCNTAPPNCSSGYTCNANKVCVANPTATPAPTATPTLTPTQGVTPRVTNVPATPTPDQSGATQIALKIGLDSIGSVGDSTNPDPSASTQIPQHLTRTVLLEIYDNQGGGTPITKDGTITYNNLPSGIFTGTVSIGNITGDHVIKVKIKGYLKKRLTGGVATIIAGQTYSPNQINLVTGDLNGDNRMDIADYNILNDCIFAPADTHGTVCSQNPDYATLSDLNDNGVKNILDYSLFVRELIVRDGD